MDLITLLFFSMSFYVIAEIVFIIWAILKIRKNTEANEILKNMVDQLYRERTENYLLTENLKKRIVELEKQLKKDPQ